MSAVYLDCSAVMRAHLERCDPELKRGLRIHFGDPTPEQVVTLLAGVTGALDGHTPMPRTILEGVRGTLQTIVYLGTGASSYIDLAAAREFGIEVRTIKGYGDRSIAEHTFALLLSAARQVARMDRALRNGRWEGLVGSELAGKTLGVVGTGNVGREVVRIAHAFGMQVLAWNRSKVDPALPCRACPLDELFAGSDAISLHLALTEKTRGIVTKQLLSIAKPTCILVNTARGALIDESALVDGLEQGRIAHAALDVFVNEPLPANSPLLRLENVTLTAHAAWNTPEASRRCLEAGLRLLGDALGDR